MGLKRGLKLVVCAGGTGGHIYPGLAVARAVLRGDPDAKILFFISEKEIDGKIVGSQGFGSRKFRTEGLGRKASLNSLRAIFLSFLSYVSALRELALFRPQALLSMGGYMGLPVVMAAWTLRIPVVLHEQNVLPGLANRLSSRFARKVAVSFSESENYFKKGRVCLTGNPVRENIIKADRSESIRALGLDPSRKTVLVAGGSQGARSINNALVEALPLMKDHKISIIHISGRLEHDKVKESASRLDKGLLDYRLYPYMDDMSAPLAAADLAVSRAGATMLAEIAARGLACVLVPYPYASELHQDLNAQAFSDKGAAVVLKDSSLSGRSLSDIIKELAGSDAKRAEMGKAARSIHAPGAAEKVKDLIYEAV